MYKLETGQVFAYDAETGQYAPLVRHADSGSMAPLTRNGTARQPAAAAVAP
jgi:hypothetical protein